MVQQPTRFCSNCGTPFESGQRFCSNCGTTIDIGIDKQTERAGSASNLSSPPDAETVADMHAQSVDPAAETYPATPSALSAEAKLSAPPPPPPDSLIQSQQPFAGYQSLPQQYPPSLSPYGAPPVYTRPQRDNSGRVLGQLGIGLLVIVLLVVALLGVGGYFVIHAITSAAGNIAKSSSTYPGGGTNNGSSTTPTGANATPASDNTTPTATPAKTVTFATPISFVYADVRVTILDAKQGDTFTDDTSISQPGVLRLDVKEENTYGESATYYYNAMQILLPDGTTADRINTKESAGIAGSVIRNNWIDFQVPANVDVHKLVLRVGSATEAQMDIPLSGNADLSKYQPKMVSPGAQTQYSGLNWTITNVKEALSYQGQQADKGQMYVTVTLKIDNNTANNFSDVPYDYLRLKAGGAVSPPTKQDIPTSISTGTNQTGTCTFKVPQGNTDFVLQLLKTTLSANGTQDASISFTVK